MKVAVLSVALLFSILLCPSAQAKSERKMKVAVLSVALLFSILLCPSAQAKALSSGCARSLPDAAVERTPEQESSRGRFRSTAQLVRQFIHSIRQGESSTEINMAGDLSPI
ncbi:unnamed protein product [Coccothraustes coccothraustes]